MKLNKPKWNERMNGWMDEWNGSQIIYLLYNSLFLFVLFSLQQPKQSPSWILGRLECASRLANVQLARYLWASENEIRIFFCLKLAKFLPNSDFITFGSGSVFISLSGSVPGHLSPGWCGWLVAVLPDIKFFYTANY